MAPSGTLPPRSPEWRERFRGQFFKTKMCRFNVEGHCRYAQGCLFAHTPADLTHAPDLTKTSLCVAWQGGNCKRSAESCPFAHGDEELRLTPAFTQAPLSRRTQALCETQGNSSRGSSSSDGTRDTDHPFGEPEPGDEDVESPESAAPALPPKEWPEVTRQPGLQPPPPPAPMSAGGDRSGGQRRARRRRRQERPPMATQAAMFETWATAPSRAAEGAVAGPEWGRRPAASPWPTFYADQAPTAMWPQPQPQGDASDRRQVCPPVYDAAGGGYPQLYGAADARYPPQMYDGSNGKEVEEMLRWAMPDHYEE